MPDAAGKRPHRRPRRRRARRLVGPQPRLLWGGRDAPGRRRPGRGEQPQPPGPLPEADIGRLKVEAAAERLGAFNSRMRLETRSERVDSEEAIAAVIEGYDFVIDAADWPAHDIEHWFNAACFAAGIPFITMSHSPPIARVGPALRARRDRLLRLPGRRLSAQLSDVRHRDRAAPRQTLAGGDAGARLRPDRRPGRARRDASPDRPCRTRRPRATPTSTTCARWRSNASR